MVQETELDLLEAIRHTVKFKELWATFSESSSAEDFTSTSSSERLALRDDIEKIQKEYFPWLADIKSKPPALHTIFDLVESHEREAGHRDRHREG